ncbi:MAG: hypothetical protein COA62_15895 [Rhodobiaceae bacterium]|nr:MAG: hypothetical protein COA62_15895 [Rhodobiaceae bacterium]
MYDITPKEIDDFQEAHGLSNDGLAILTGLKSDKGPNGAGRVVSRWKHRDEKKRAYPPGAAVMIIWACKGDPTLVDLFYEIGVEAWTAAGFEV